MLQTVQRGYFYWITLTLAVLAGGMMVRIFIFFHDCCHGSFFASRSANTILGYVSGVATFTPFEDGSMRTTRIMLRLVTSIAEVSVIFGR
jgi:acyl-lipid omega-6 desaturase (Delta-12 desaturase)